MRRRVAIFADRDQPGAAAALHTVRTVVGAHAEVAVEAGGDSSGLPGDAAIDLIVAIGGDGTLLRQCLLALERDVPIVGVNNGRLGFLAEFDIEELGVQGAEVFGTAPLVRPRMALGVSVRGPDGRTRLEGAAVNEAAVVTGRPFRMMQLSVHFDGKVGPDISGDGVIACTPVGSTAYNASAGGPIVHPDHEAIVITPNAAHSLAFRPIVVSAATRVEFRMKRVNDGTTLLLDGAPEAELRPGDCLEVRRHPRALRLIGNPKREYWNTLLTKLRWAAPPTYRDRGV